MKGILFIIALFAATSLSAQTVTVNKDTAEIPASVHFIRVDGKIYEIKRETSLQEVKEPGSFPFWQGSGTLQGGGIIPNTGTVRFYNGTIPHINSAGPYSLDPVPMPILRN